MANKEKLLAQAKEANIEVPEDATKAQIQALLDEQKPNDESAEDSTEAEDSADDNDSETTPADQAAEDVEKSGVQNTDVDGSTVNEDAGEDEPDAKSDGANDEDQTVAAQPEGIDGVDRDHTPNTDKPEEAAAARAGVSADRLDDPKQNREPKNDFEQENQKVTEVERQAAQEVSDMTTKERVENSPEPNEAAAADAEATVETNHGAIADAIADGFRRSKDDSFALQEEPGVEHRFSLVKNKQTGEVMVRENETGTLSKIQLLSLEEKEADVQATEVEEIQYNHQRQGFTVFPTSKQPSLGGYFIYGIIPPEADSLLLSKGIISWSPRAKKSN